MLQLLGEHLDSNDSVGWVLFRMTIDSGIGLIYSLLSAKQALEAIREPYMGHPPRQNQSLSAAAPSCSEQSLQEASPRGHRGRAG